MNGILCTTEDTLMLAPGDVHELVRGQEQILLERLMPLVRQQNVILDLRHVERIDAAGIAALISLYACALNAGRDFTVSHASPRIEEILALVGLDHILLSHNAVPNSPSEPRFGRPAA
ncbi:MAG: STAS domain-containing protein [Acidobacteriota bacterium]|nr:STAS domain-containing protein [Acidobacteriota bacterium]